MIDIVTHLKQQFDWAMTDCLDAYEVLADGRSFERSGRDEYAIGVFKSLYDSVDAIPRSLILATKRHREAAPQLFEAVLESELRLVGLDYAPANANDFLEAIQARMGTE